MLELVRYPFSYGGNVKKCLSQLFISCHIVAVIMIISTLIKVEKVPACNQADDLARFSKALATLSKTSMILGRPCKNDILIRNVTELNRS